MIFSENRVPLFGIMLWEDRPKENRQMANAATITAGTAPAIGAGSPPAVSEHVDPARVVAFVAMCFGMFMAFLDIQVVSASLSEIQAGLAASADEVTWVQTSYLMAEVVAIPLSGFLSRALGTRIMFAGAAAGFTVASLMCGLTSTMNQMIFWRAVQGFIGGGMVPTVFASAYAIFPRSKQPIVTPIIGLVATLAPTIGPTVGGYLTDLASWHWLFFINIVPGIVVTIAAATLIDFDEPNFKLFERFDWTGLIFMALFLGALEYVLEDGPRYDWFEDETVFAAAVISASSAVIFFARVLTARQPIVDLRAFADRNFAVGSMFSFVLGIGLYGLTYLYPIYLAQISRLQCADDRTDAVHLRRHHVPDRAAGRPADDQGRCAVDAGVRLCGGRAEQLADDLSDQGLGILAALSAAIAARLRHDVRDRADHQYLARHARSGAAEERIRPVQSDAQPRRRRRPCRTQHRAGQAHRPASGAAARLHHLGAPPGGGSAHRLCRAHAGLRRAKHGAQATFPVRTPAGHGDGLCRRVPAAVPVVRRLCLSGILAAATADGRSSHG